MNAQFLKRAIDIAERESKDGQNGPFGALIALNDNIISEGWNQVVETNDPTAHAEIVAIRKACRLLGRFDLEGCILYTSCEPCPMCLSAIYWARIPLVCYASTKEDAEKAGFDDDFIYRELAIPMDKRQVRFVQELREQGNRVFDAWIQNPNKLMY